MAKLAQGSVSPKRFYEKAVAADDGAGHFEVQLDGRPAKTPKRNQLATPFPSLADAVASEWAAVEEIIDTSAMPLTKLLATVIDLGEDERENWRQVVINFLQSDLLCYRASDPVGLVEQQKKVWDPYLDQWKVRFGGDLKITAGISAVEQPTAIVKAASRYLAALSKEHLLAVKCATEVTGSAVLASALLDNVTLADDIFAASRIDEHFQEERWGVDKEAKDREQGLMREFEAIATFLALTQA